MILAATLPESRYDARSQEVLMPDSDTETTSIFDIEPDEELEAQLDAEAEADVAAGRVVPHERVREWLMQLARGQKVPPPIP